MTDSHFSQDPRRPVTRQPAAVPGGWRRRQALALAPALALAWREVMAGSAMSGDAAVAATDDPWQWLEAVDSDRALAWVRARNAESRALLQAEPGFDALRSRLLAILDSKDRIPALVRRGDFVYNFWRDAGHPRGVWRRTTLDGFRQPQPPWQTLLDLDALARAENENWVWSGATTLGPRHRRALVRLSRGGADAVVVREFDLVERRFVADGFVLPEAKTDVSWIDADQLYVGTDFGPGSLTDSGYPRLIKRWRRGTPLAAAQTVFEGQRQDVSVDVSVNHTPGFERTVFSRALDFYTHQRWLLVDGALQPLALPADATPEFWRDRVLLRLRSDWDQAGVRWPGGSLLVGEAAGVVGPNPPPARWQSLFTPGGGRSLEGWTCTGSQVLLHVMQDVASTLQVWQPPAEAALDEAPAAGNAAWTGRQVATPGRGAGTLAVQSLRDDWLGTTLSEDPLAEHYLLHYTDFLTPDTLLLGNTSDDRLQPLKTLPALFDADGMRVEQRFAVSSDGTRVPYFIVWPRGADGGASMPTKDRPTLLYGYGGFEISLQPWYSGAYGSAWLARGGVFVVANIRGGGEYGPAWHQAAVKAQKQRSYDDFIAVAQDLIARGVTTPRRLGIEGGSNGGLLVGAVLVQRPELFGAVVCQVPLLDMRRYHLLLAGASWMAEYGNPDVPDEWALMRRWSPYHNLRPANAGAPLPQVLFTTSTRDDRVHPGHARKMAARMHELGHRVLYWENIEGGHGGAADNAQKADMLALEFSFLWRVLGG